MIFLLSFLFIATPTQGSNMSGLGGMHLASQTVYIQMYIYNLGFNLLRISSVATWLKHVFCKIHLSIFQ